MYSLQSQHRIVNDKSKDNPRAMQHEDSFDVYERWSPCPGSSDNRACDIIVYRVHPVDENGKFKRNKNGYIISQYAVEYPRFENGKLVGYYLEYPYRGIGGDGPYQVDANNIDDSGFALKVAMVRDGYAPHEELVKNPNEPAERKICSAVKAFIEARNMSNDDEDEGADRYEEMKWAAHHVKKAFDKAGYDFRRQLWKVEDLMKKHEKGGGVSDGTWKWIIQEIGQHYRGD